MSRSTISTFQLFAMYSDEESARIYLEGRNIANHTTKRLDAFVDATKGKRLTYERLIAWRVLEPAMA
jgi:hypothetical protein